MSLWLKTGSCDAVARDALLDSKDERIVAAVQPLGELMNHMRPKLMRLAVLPLLVMALGLVVIPPGNSRPWKPDAKSAAEDYSQILHHKSNTELVLLWWVVPQMVENTPQVAQVLDQYVVVAIANGRVTPAGQMTFSNITTL